MKFLKTLIESHAVQGLCAPRPWNFLVLVPQTAAYASPLKA